MSIPENLAAILARIDAARKVAIAPAPQTALVAIAKTVDELKKLNLPAGVDITIKI